MLTADDAYDGARVLVTLTYAALAGWILFQLTNRVRPPRQTPERVPSVATTPATPERRSGATATTPDRSSPRRGTLSVALSSANADKVSSVKAAFEAATGKNVKVESLPSDSGIPHGQPWGLQCTYEGAAARLHHMRRRSTSAHTFLVSVENGVLPIVSHEQTSAHDVACVIVESRSGERAHAFSQSRPYPLEAVQRMKREGRSGQEIGAWCREHYEGQRLCCSRADQIRECTTAVLSSMRLV